MTFGFRHKAAPKIITQGQVNLANLAKGLIFLQEGYNPIDLVNRALWTQPFAASNTVATACDLTGRTSTVSTTNVDLYTIPVATGNTITVLAVVLNSIGRGSGSWVCARYNTAATTHWLMQINGSNQPSFRADNTTPTSFECVHQNSTVGDKLSIIVGRVTAANVVEVFLNGIPPTTPVTLTGTSAVNTTVNSSNDAMGVGNRHPNFSNVPCGPIVRLAMWDRDLTNAEVAYVSSNPRSPLFKVSKRRYVKSSGTNTYTLSISGGFTLSGAVALLRTRLQAISGGILFSGSVTQLRTRVQVPSGGITFGGAVPELRTRILAPSGGVVFGGSAPITFIPAGGSVGNPQRTLVGVGQ